MSVEVFKFGPLIATVKHLGSSDLYRVTLTGKGDVFEASVETTGHMEAAAEVVQELASAAEFPQRFFSRRKIAAVQSGAEGALLLDMMDVANEAILYAARNKRHLEDAVRAIDDDRARSIAIGNRRTT